jgi:hypothetical protein
MIFKDHMRVPVSFFRIKKIAAAAAETLKRVTERIFRISLISQKQIKILN